jgi:heterotetrameric sarcosine oxidase gamma subunit
MHELRGGWEVAVSYGHAGTEALGAEGTLGFADTSPAPKLELQGHPAEIAALSAEVGASLEAGQAGRASAAWWCPLGLSRLLVLGEIDVQRHPLRSFLEQAVVEHAPAAHISDQTTSWASLTLVGPRARETLAQLTAIDLRPTVSPAGAFRPGSLARAPGAILCEDSDRYRLLFGWAIGEYMWTVVADAAAEFGGTPIGAEALPDLPAVPQTAPALNHA